MFFIVDFYRAKRFSVVKNHYFLGFYDYFPLYPCHTREMKRFCRGALVIMRVFGRFMEIHRWQRQLNIARPLVLTIGNFDGVHLGHQALLSRLQARAAEVGGESALMSFFPHPRAVIGKQSPAMLSTLRDRAFWLRHFGLAHWIVLSFTQTVRHLPPEDFVRDYLGRFPLRLLLIGDDFRFGFRGAGDFAWLQEHAPRFGFAVEALPSVRCDGERISSSRVRAALNAHDIDGAQQLLGHSLTLTARVRRGYGRGGRQLSRPTANLHLPALWCLPDGVYVVKIAALSAAQEYWGVANIGAAPTFGVTRRRLEVHVPGVDLPLYDALVQVSIAAFLREIRTFADAQELQAQIHDDIARAREVVARLAPQVSLAAWEY